MLTPLPAACTCAAGPHRVDGKDKMQISSKNGPLPGREELLRRCDSGKRCREQTSERRV